MGLEQQEKAINNDDINNQLLSEVITSKSIADVVSFITGIPVSKLSESDKEKLLKLNERLSNRVLGQNRAVSAISDAILRSRAGIQASNVRPTFSGLFLGTSGVGKTELAKALCEELFDDDSNIIRLDMSEYQEKHTVSKLLGAPAGYIGFEEKGFLT